MENQVSETQLSVSEAVLLGHAMVQRVADSVGVRAFFIKGPASVIQGLRMPRTSGDVDVLVRPEQLEAMLECLRKRGWRPRPVDPDTKAFPRHSVTLYHADWPCNIDVHFRFPGMEEALSACFDVMWANTEDVELAGQNVKVSSRALGTLILALHALRSYQLPACRQELEFLSGLTERLSMTAELLNLASATGSMAASRPFLEELLSETVTVEWPVTSREWRNRRMAEKPGSARLIAIAQAPLREKPMMLLRAAFPTSEVHLAGDIYADRSVRGRLRSHRARWTRFLRAAPGIVREVRRPPQLDRAVDRCEHPAFGYRER